MRVQILKTEFVKDNLCKEIRVGVKRENLGVPKTKLAVLIKVLVSGIS